jgi:FHS family L-fucose permease-like MFS transporter
VPPLLGKTADLHNSTAFAMVVPVCFFIAAWSCKCLRARPVCTDSTDVYLDALCVNFVPVYRDTADQIGESDVGLRNDSVTPPDDVEKGDLQEVERMEFDGTKATERSAPNAKH